jgi:hypothetical protein
LHDEGVIHVPLVATVTRFLLKMFRDRRSASG